MVGRVGRPHGLAGFVTVWVLSDAPERFRRGASMYVGGERLKVEAVRDADRGLLVRFEGCRDRAAAEHLRGCELAIDPHERRPLDADEFWPDDLEGLEVRLVDGTVVGSVREVVDGAAQDRLVVDTPDGTVEIPFVAELVPRVCVKEGFVEVVPLEGLFSGG